MDKKGWGLIGSIVLLAIILTGVFYFNKNAVKETQLFKQAEFSTVNISESWKSFREELNISQSNAKVENFNLILDKNSNIYSVRFDVVDKSNDRFTIYHYQNCFSCELEEEKQVQIDKSVSDEWLQYQKLVDADEFFSKLDILKENGFFENSDFKYALIHSTGWNEGIGLDGDYYVLEDDKLKKLDKTKPDMLYKGFNLQVIGNNVPESFSTNEDTTRTVFIANFKEEKLNKE